LRSSIRAFAWWISTLLELRNGHLGRIQYAQRHTAAAQDKASRPARSLISAQASSANAWTQMAVGKIIIMKDDN
jgi:hypothetical protein